MGEEGEEGEEGKMGNEETRANLRLGSLQEQAPGKKGKKGESR